MTDKGNYLLSRERAEKYFLQFDQDMIIESHGLEHDDRWLYAEFIHEKYRIDRQTGHVEKSADGFATVKEASHTEALSVFDFLCHNMTVHGQAEAAAAGRAEGVLSGRWAPVNSLKGRPKTVGVGTGTFFDQYSELFDADQETFAAACEALGGTRVLYGDIGYQIPVWKDISVLVKFYARDEEFPPQTTLLFDENLLSFLFYETVFYVASVLLGRIAEEMDGSL